MATKNVNAELNHTEFVVLEFDRNAFFTRICYLEKIFEEILPEQKAVPITGVLIVQRDSVVHLVETPAETSTAYLRQIQSLNSEIEPGARIVENVRQRITHDTACCNMHATQGTVHVQVTHVGCQQARRLWADGKMCVLARVLSPVAIAAAYDQVKVLVSSEDCPSAYFSKWFHYNVQLNPEDNVDVDSEDTLEASWGVFE